MRAVNTPQDLWSRMTIKSQDECWEWQLSCSPGGYGYFSLSGKRVWAHRLAYELINGDTKGLFVLHKCDNPPCCNPSHLFLGTLLDNNRDRDRKGRGVNGERHHSCRLTRQQVETIRRQFDSGTWTKRDLSNEYGVSDVMIGKIVRRESWKSI